MVAFFTHRIYTPVDNKITVVIGQPKITPLSHNQIYCTALPMLLHLLHWQL